MQQQLIGDGDTPGGYPKKCHVNGYNDARNHGVLVPSCASCKKKRGSNDELPEKRAKR